MIATVLRVSLINLRRDYVVLGMTFVLPIAFFSIFAMIFGGASGRSATPAVSVALVDEDRTDFSQRLVAQLKAEPSLKVQTTDTKEPNTPLKRAAAEAAVRSGNVPAAIILPAGLGASFPSFSGAGPEVEILLDPADPVAPQMAAGLLQKAAMMAAPDLMMRRGMETLEQFGGFLTDRQKELIDQFSIKLRQDTATAPTSQAAITSGEGFGGLIHTKMIEAAGSKPDESGQRSLISYQAAATAVMFLLFMASGAGGALLDEQESGTLERVLSTHLSMGGLLTGKWLFVTLLGVAQLSVMFLWGALAFKLDLFTARHLVGFAIMTIPTAAAAAAFGLVLATLCKSRGQLGGISTIVILMMSALGGSMIPRFIMSESLQKIGLFTFNAWALDGYRKVFWYEDVPLFDIWPQELVLVAATVVLLTAARIFARRWETA